MRCEHACLQSFFTKTTPNRAASPGLSTSSTVSESQDGTPAPTHLPYHNRFPPPQLGDMYAHTRTHRSLPLSFTAHAKPLRSLCCTRDAVQGEVASPWGILLPHQHTCTIRAVEIYLFAMHGDVIERPFRLYIFGGCVQLPWVKPSI